jgi:hypothetical protein
MTTTRLGDVTWRSQPEAAAAASAAEAVLTLSPAAGAAGAVTHVLET